LSRTLRREGLHIHKNGIISLGLANIAIRLREIEAHIVNDHQFSIMSNRSLPTITHPYPLKKKIKF